MIYGTGNVYVMYVGIAFAQVVHFMGGDLSYHFYPTYIGEKEAGEGTYILKTINILLFGRTAKTYMAVLI